MRTRTARTPPWVKALLIAFVIVPSVWWLADRKDRVGNQTRLAAIASVIAERPVEVQCPGPIARQLFGWDPVDGSVAFGPDGQPADETKLRAEPCDELDALAEGRRAPQLACAERSTSCGDDTQALAQAVDVLAHEAWHLQGVQHEGITECRSLQTMAWTAQRLGATEAQGRGLARVHYLTGYRLLPARYQHGGCSEAGELDMRPDDPDFP